MYLYNSIRFRGDERRLNFLFLGGNKYFDPLKLLKKQTNFARIFSYNFNPDRKR